MKQYGITFLKRGLIAASGGPVILAVIYAILGASGQVNSLTPREVSLGILTVTLLAFIAAGVSVVYQIERLPMLPATLIHAGVLYLDYLLNDWMERSWRVIGIFTACFILGYGLIWGSVYLSIRRKTRRINAHLQGGNQ